MPPPLLVCGKNIENFVAFLIAHLERLFHLEHIDLKGWPHNWHGYHVAKWYVDMSLGFGMNLMPLQHFNYLDLMLHLDMDDFFVSSCINYLQLRRRPKSQANLLSRQGHHGIRLHWKQFTIINKRGTKCKYSFKRKIG